MSIKCPKCQSDNTDTAKFCSNCATQLRPGGPPTPALTKTLESPAFVLSKESLVSGKYRITEEIGRGGMGVVYEAEDTKLARKVAIKVLPEVFMADPERLVRFEREARVLATLNHPNVAAIHGVEEADGKRFLVLEFVEGETLAERLIRGPLSLEETVDICRQIAEGLEGAHEKNIIHRDLKPSNIKIAPDGKVKILDFGLARAFHDQISDIDLAKSPTITADMTQPGVILGTAAYMSPEQAKGKPVDKRADIWAFGCVLYECLTGIKAFRGETITETLAAILKGEPDWNLLPSGTPPAIQRLLRLCLARERRHRLFDIHDAGLEIKDSGLEPILKPGVGIPNRYFSRRFVVWTAAISVGLTVLVALLVQYLLTKKAPAQVPSIVRFAVPDAFTASRPIYPALDLSPDGRRMISVGERDDKSQLFLRTLDKLEPSPLDGTENAQAPFFSPDGRRIGFFAEGKLKTLAITGGAPTAVCEVVNGISGSWGLDDTIVFAPGWGSGLLVVSAAGGTPRRLTTPSAEKGEITHLWPQILPGGKAILYTIIPGDIQSADDSLIAVQIIGQKDPHIVIRGGSYGRYVATGHLIYLRNGALLAVRFDLKTLQVSGTPIMVLDNVQSSDSTGVGHFAVSETGTLAYALGGEYKAENSLVLADLKGNIQPFLPDKNFSEPAFSPDGRVAMRIAAANDDIWLFDPERKQLARFTFGFGDEMYPVWTPDGKRIIFSWGRTNLFWKAADGGGEPEQLSSGKNYRQAGSISPDGNLLAFCELNPFSQGDIWLLPLKGERKPQRFLATSFNEKSPRFSPNGRWIAYSSDESGRDEIYLQRVQETGVRKQISTAGGYRPVWSHTGKKLFFLNGNRMMATEVDPESGEPGSTESLFELQNLAPPSWAHSGYDIAPDDDHFVMVIKNDQPPATEVRIVLNWFEELKRLVPTGKK